MASFSPGAAASVGVAFVLLLSLGGFESVGDLPVSDDEVCHSKRACIQKGWARKSSAPAARTTMAAEVGKYAFLQLDP